MITAFQSDAFQNNTFQILEYIRSLKPVILVDNILEGATLSVTNTDSNAVYHIDNLIDGREFTYWKAENILTNPIIINIDCGVSKIANCIGIANHNLLTSGCTLSIEASDDNFSLETIIVKEEYIPTSNNEILFNFTQTNKRYWRIKIIDASVVPLISVIYMGARLEMENYLNSGIDPVITNLKTFSQTSSKGHFLGTIKKYTGVTLTASFSNLTASWVIDSFKPVWDEELSQLKPFFWSWGLLDSTSEAYFVKLEDNASLQMPRTPLYHNLTFTMSGTL